MGVSHALYVAQMRARKLWLRSQSGRDVSLRGICTQAALQAEAQSSRRRSVFASQLFPALLAPCKAAAVSITLKDKITPGSPLSDCPCALPGQLSLTEVAFFSCRILGAGHDPPRVLLVCRRGLVC